MIREAVLFSAFYMKGLAGCKIGTISLIGVVEQPNIVAKKISVFQL
jgi:hypothetical protein